MAVNSFMVLGLGSFSMNVFLIDAALPVLIDSGI